MSSLLTTVMLAVCIAALAANVALAHPNGPVQTVTRSTQVAQSDMGGNHRSTQLLSPPLPSSLLHELFHSSRLTETNFTFTDGPLRNCYNDDCVKGLVRAGGEVPNPPWTVAGAYEFYAYAVRARKNSPTAGCVPDDYEDSAPPLNGTDLGTYLMQFVTKKDGKKG
ncbi:hypothetical protein MMC16_003800 [Acarospora aff. strigata]|nr:hypothetical protein [Acarospora aff. strigata]